jgi:hypothetical protein
MESVQNPVYVFAVPDALVLQRIPNNEYCIPGNLSSFLVLNRPVSVFAVPDALVLKVLVERLSQLDCVSRGYILHGYPLSREQAEQLAAAGHTPNRYADHFPSSSLHFPHFLFSNFPHFLNFPFSSFPIFLISHFP